MYQLGTERSALQLGQAPLARGGRGHLVVPEDQRHGKSTAATVTGELESLGFVCTVIMQKSSGPIRKMKHHGISSEWSRCLPGSWIRWGI